MRRSMTKLVISNLCCLPYSLISQSSPPWLFINGSSWPAWHGSRTGEQEGCSLWLKSSHIVLGWWWICRGVDGCIAWGNPIGVRADRNIPWTRQHCHRFTLHTCLTLHLTTRPSMLTLKAAKFRSYFNLKMEPIAKPYLPCTANSSKGVSFVQMSPAQCFNAIRLRFRMGALIVIA